MRRRHRAIILIAAGWLIASAAPHPNSETEREQSKAQQSIASSLNNIVTIYNEQTERSKRADKLTKPCGPGEYESKDDLCAQWKAADAAADAAWWAAFSGWFGGLSFVGVLAALGIGYHANRIARQSMEVQDRAWIAIDYLESVGFRIENDLPRFVFKAKFENVGATPAIHFRYFAHMAFGDNPRDHVDTTISQFDNGTIDWIEANLFPNRPLERRVSCDHEGTPPGVVRTHLYIVACYQTVFSKEARFTAVLFQIQDLRRTDGLIDYKDPPYGKHIHVGSPEEFVGYAT